MIIPTSGFLCLFLAQSLLAASTGFSTLKSLEDALNEIIARPGGPPIEYIMERIGLTHPEQALTVDQAVDAVHIASIANDDLGYLFRSPTFQQFVNDKQNAVELYNFYKTKLHSKLYKPSYLKDLKAFAYNHGFPDHFNSVSQIMAYRKAEQVDFLVESPAFVKFTNDRTSLETLLHEIDKERKQTIDGITVWNNQEYVLQGKLYLYRLNAARENNRKTDIVQYQRYLEKWFEVAGSYSNIHQSAIYQDLLHNWQNAQMVWLTLKNAKTPTETLSYLMSLTGKTFQDHLKQVKTVKDLYNIVKLFHDKDTFEILSYLSIIHDPFKAFQLRKMLESEIINDQSPVLASILKSAVRKYNGENQVLATLKNIEVYGGDTFYYLNGFEPYIEYISDPGRAMNLLNEIEKNPSTYSAFIGHSSSFNKLKTAAYKNWFPKPDSTAEKIAQSYRKLLSVRAHENFQYDDNYSRFISKGTIYKIQLLNEMKKVGIPSDDELIAELKGASILGGLLDVIERKDAVGVKEFLLSKEMVNLVYEMANRKVFGGRLVDGLVKLNPDFANDLKQAATMKSSQ